MKILFCASYPNQPIGYSTIAHMISNYLTEQGHEIFYFGFSNFENVAVKDIKFNHKITYIDVYKEESVVTENFGTTIICKYVREINPDFIFIYNDIIVTSRLINALQELRNERIQFQTQTTPQGNNLLKYKLILYIDLVYPYEKLRFLEYVNREADKILLFSECWKKNLKEIGFPEHKLSVFPHFMNRDRIYNIDKSFARKFLKLQDNDFIVVNTNRNAYRKLWDITIRAFLIFYKKTIPLKLNKTPKLYINCLLSEGNYDILNIIKVECIKSSLDYDYIINNLIIRSNSSGYVSEEILCNIYNAADVGINTCGGEGFGLCNLEGASLGIPQVVAGAGALVDIFHTDDEDLLKRTVITPKLYIDVPNCLDEHNGHLYICDPNDFADTLFMYYTSNDLRIIDGLKQSAIVAKYKFDNYKYILNNIF